MDYTKKIESKLKKTVQNIGLWVRIPLWWDAASDWIIWTFYSAVNSIFSASYVRCAVTTVQIFKFGHKCWLPKLTSSIAPVGLFVCANRLDSYHKGKVGTKWLAKGGKHKISSVIYDHLVNTWSEHWPKKAFVSSIVYRSAGQMELAGISMRYASH